MHPPQILKKIRNASQSVLGRIPYVPPPPLHTNVSLALPNPAPIINQLIQSGCKQAMAIQLSDLYLQHAMRLKKGYEKNMQDAFRACMQLDTGVPDDLRLDMSALYDGHLASYRRDLSHWTQAIIQRSELRVQQLVASRPNLSTSNVSDHRVQFKQNAIVLEAAFSNNQYPTRADKERLANCTGIEYRQIDIWFQNRRNRSKREGKGIRKLAFVMENVIPPQVPHESTKSPIASSTFPSEENISASPLSHSLCPQPETNEELTMLSRHAPCPFEISAAPHAFPNTFPPVCDYKPFPALDGLPTFDIPWPRHTSTQRRRNNNDSDHVEVEHLCAPLSRMTLTDKRVPPTASSCRPRRSRNHAPACFPCLIYPPTAPLPALMPVNVTAHIATSAAGSSYTSSSISQHIVCSPTSPATLPRRTCTRKSLNTTPLRPTQFVPKQTRDATHPYRSHKSTRPNGHQAKLSRLSSVSSLSSMASDHSCSSRASSASLESPPPITPPQLSVELPRSRKEDLVFSPSQELDHLFSDSYAPTLSFLDIHQPQIVQ